MEPAYAKGSPLSTANLTDYFLNMLVEAKFQSFRADRGNFHHPY